MAVGLDGGKSWMRKVRLGRNTVHDHLPKHRELAYLVGFMYFGLKSWQGLSLWLATVDSSSFEVSHIGRNIS